MNFEQTRQVLDFDSETGEYRTTYEYPSRPPSVAVPLALMEMTGDDVTAFEPMYDAGDVNPEALDAMFSPECSESSPESRVTFPYHDWEVTVESFGRIVIRPEGDATKSL